MFALVAVASFIPARIRRRITRSIDVAPRPEGGAAPIAVVVGGVRVVDRDPRNTSSRQMRRPMLSVSITIDCPVSSVATCRKLAEKVQLLIQFPEMVE